ncbi:MAG: solute carrier family 23 protein [Lachnospiraceae bacterium]|nr:solute carrier family 23 protein [Lachnospiraceae bacterium]
MNLVYDIKDRPPFGQVVLFAIQQLLAIIAATIAVPAVVNNFCIESALGYAGNPLSASAALFGAGCGTFIYLLFTRSKSPVFLGSSFAFLGSMMSAFAGAISMQAGCAGLIAGAVMAGLVYVIIAIVVKFAGVNWIDKLMPPVVIGPTVAIIGLSLAGNAIGDFTNGGATGSPYVAMICGLVTLFTVILCSTYGKKMAKLIPFFIGIIAGYLTATIFYLIGNATGNDALKVIDFSALQNMGSFIALPDFAFLKADWSALTGSYLLTIFAAYAPVAFVVFAEHLSDHKNLSTIIGHNLLEEPGLSRTLLGDGIGSMVGAFFGGACNTTYGESIACVGITRNASVVSIWGAGILCILFSLITPLVCFLETIPSCVMGGVCITLYGFIASSGFKMFQKVDLNKNRNLFTACVIFIAGVGGLTVSFGKVTLTTVACALILGIIVNKVLANEKD